MKSLKTCAVIPAFNEEENIGEVIRETKKYVDDVIVIDDGSTDNTSMIAEMTGARVLRHDINRGYGAAIKSCFNTARRFEADVTVILDGDGQHNPKCIPKLIKPIREKNMDVVVGSRFLDVSNNIPAYRRVGLNILNRLTWLFSRENLDSQSGFRAYSMKAIHTINPVDNGMGISSEILMSAKQHNLGIKEVPITVRYDRGKSSKNPVDHGLSVIASIIKFMSQKRPLVFFGLTGLVFFITGVSLGWVVLDSFNRSSSLMVGTAMATVIFIITGVFLMGMGMTVYAIQDTIHRSITELEQHKRLLEFTLDKLEKGGHDRVREVRQ